ncbi:MULTISPECIES: hypothetical protein [unclassified Mesorhizobium]|uniref:hypothetical protein n=1 Tax=unclassified Mesorhizobium TaxID=325217 RepID=UPI003335F319
MTTDVDQRATVGRSIDQEMARATSQFDSDRRVNQPQAQAIEKQLQVLKSTGNAVAAQQAGLHAMERQFPPHRISSKAFCGVSRMPASGVNSARRMPECLRSPHRRAARSLHPIFLLPVPEIPT